SIVITAWRHNAEPIIALNPTQTETIFLLICASTYLALVGFCNYFVNVSDRAEMRLEQELRRSDQLLLNILPLPIANRLKITQDTIADSYDSVTVLFADIVGFTKLSSIRPDPEIVDMLNEVFSMFDRIAERHGLEKIKTIG